MVMVRRIEPALGALYVPEHMPDQHQGGSGYACLFRLVSNIGEGAAD
jgi:hypothetical protein